MFTVFGKWGRQPTRLEHYGGTHGAGSTTCLVCASDSWTIDLNSTDILNLAPPFVVVRCAKCDLRALSPQPTGNDYARLYERHYFSAPDQVDDPLWLGDYPAVPYQNAMENESRRLAYKARLERLAKLIPKGGSLFDIGLAEGDFAEMAVQFGWKVSGVDISEAACQRARSRGIEAFSGDFLDLDLRGRKFDVIHLHHVFEHFLHPIAAISKLKSLMHERSVLVIEVPNQWDSWTRRVVNSIKILLRRKGRRTVWSVHHPYFYTRRNLKTLLEKNGLRIFAMKSYFPERWSGPTYRRILQAIDLVADATTRKGENLEVMTQLESLSSGVSGPGR